MGQNIEEANFSECLKKGRLKKFAEGPSLIEKEIENARNDLETAFDSITRENYKWATIQAYYAMFHTARALLYSKGFRERSHYCLIVAIKALFVAEKLLDIRLVEVLQMAKTLRENADYENEFSQDSAETLAEKAQEFLSKAKEILKLNN
ncbi:MAG: HEPN domain-containing protein [Candidatus Omnitrophica bacterium]|nr:HEPN domain-containing protein [Candidatus Omnitrophota bacterium]